MTNQETSIADRLLEAGNPRVLWDWEKRDGYYTTTCRATKEDVSGLIEIVRNWSNPDWVDENLDLASDEGDLEEYELLPVTAWRTLADLKSSESVEPLIYLLGELDGDIDDWLSSELPHVFGKIGRPAIEPLVQLANDTDMHDLTRAIAADGLRYVAEYNPDTRDEVVTQLTAMMTNAAQDSIEFNSTLLVGLDELKAVEAAEAIERAFADNLVDVGVIGDWEDVRSRLGVEGLGLEMPEHPHNSIASLRRRMGIGIFSDMPLFRDGELDSDAEQAYYERAWDLFSQSHEAKQVVDRYGDLNSFRMLLDYGLHYRGESVDEMTLDSVEEFLFEYVPRQVSAPADGAAAMVLELGMFWEYLDRAFTLPNAKPIIEWLKASDIGARLEAAMSDPANFGMAKSIVMSGIEAGYDMTSEEGMAQFMAAYNRSLQPAPTDVVRPKAGRNDPCPCGSGKKYKKCCR